ncbi:Protein of unknown function [Mariniphaga anaerophila]|uniref:DUF2891 domain-containing protein n=1 Tax=Mariniphaga anaerophila TaxID=1484053 RepID=A0A1M5AK68_9BACT|nr:DUF2891 domain-containing protein [Mariniphaga anaerophila]SHF30536.1 Protein of unknown function [Mariniphaga anaerophila]
MKTSIFLFLMVFCFSTQAQYQKNSGLEFDKEKANYLYHFAYDCIDQEYPNKLGQVLGNDSYLAPPRELHPAFYGCFDWHSSVHGHWTLVTILNTFPDFEYRNEILAKLKKNITSENIRKEVEYFDDEHNKNFERTYGWAWLLKLDEALRDWGSPEAIELQKNLQPLTTLVSQKFNDFLEKLIYPIRVGEHNNIAFGMSFAYDYAKKYDPALAQQIGTKAREYFMEDCNCPLTWEPGGFDFLSPCLQEAALMQKILPKDEFKKWLKKFLPGFEKNPAKFLTPAVVTDRSDGKLAHLDGLNFSRAWCLFEIGNSLTNNEMTELGVLHFNYSYEKMDSGEYAGAHWLASFATYALIKYKAMNEE